VESGHRLTRKHSRRTNEGKLRLLQAYRSVFQGQPSRQQQDMVLADLAAQSGFYKVSHESVSSSALTYREGKRALFAQIFSALSLSPNDMSQLENAARHEAIDIDQSQDF